MRLEARVKMGYYPTPASVVDRVRTFLEFPRIAVTPDLEGAICHVVPGPVVVETELRDRVPAQDQVGSRDPGHGQEPLCEKRIQGSSQAVADD